MSNGLPQRHRSPDDDWRFRFVEEMGGLILVHGTPRAVMRVLGWMVVCEPAEQTAPEVQEQLELSAGSVSTALRSLSDTGVLERMARPGDRRIFYRLSPKGWELALEARFRAMGEMRRLAERALDAADGAGDERLVEMRDFYGHMETGVADLLRQSSERKLPRPGLTLHR
jgi:DNA-binding MarR family transcriptional regulator